MGGTNGTETLRNGGLAIIAVGVLIAGLVYGCSFLVPLAVAIFLWNVLEAMIQGFAGIRLGGYTLPRWLAAILGFVSVALGLYLVSTILLGQLDAIGEAWPRYVARFETIVTDLTLWLGPERSAKLKEAIAAIDLTRQVPVLLASTQSIVFSLLLVVAYVGFMFVERGYVAQKVAAMFPDEQKFKQMTGLLATISDSVQHYIWIKTIVSIATGAACYAILRWVGVDFAETWALLIFVLNYIPNIGSIVAVMFPALLALVQFDTLGPFFILLFSLTAIQLTIGSVIEPIFMGSTLNMSPLAIMVGLAFWGVIWGVVGMFLSVPILVTIMIVCAHVPSWRWVAILLSKDGRIEPSTVG